MIVRQLLTKWGFRVDTKGLQKLERAVNTAKLRISSGFNDIKRSIRGAGIAVAAITAGVGLLLKEAGDFEQIQIAFETMLQSGLEAAKLLKDITAFALKTPFNLKGLFESSKRLLAFGFSAKEVLPILNDLGNISAGVGRDKLPRLILALGQVRAATRLRGQELRQFTEAGVPLLEELAKQTGKTEAEITKMISAGAVGFDMVRKALEGLTSGSGRFANLMQKQSKSFLGILSNIIDAVQILARDIGAKLLPEGKRWANMILTLISNNEKMKKVQDTVVAGVKILIRLAKNLGFVFGNVFDAMKPFVRLLGGSTNAMQALVNIFLVLTGARLLIGIGNLTIGLFQLAKALFTIKAIALLLPALVGLAVVAVGLILEDIIGFFQGKDSVTEIVIEKVGNAVDFVIEQFGRLPNFFKSIATRLESVFAGPLRVLENILGIFDDVASLIGGDKSFGEFLADIDRRVGSALPLIGDLFAQTGEGLARRVFGFENGTQTTGGIATPNQSTNRTSNSATIQAPINISVPPGTPPELVGEKIRQGSKDAFTDILRSTNVNVRSQQQF